GDGFVNFPSTSIFGVELLQNVSVIGTAGDSLFKDGRIGGHSTQAIFINQPLEFAAGDQVATNVVEPYRLAKFLQQFEGIFLSSLYGFWRFQCANRTHKLFSLVNWPTAYRFSISWIFFSRRTWRSSPVKRAFRKVREISLASSAPITRAPSTRTLVSSC